MIRARSWQSRRRSHKRFLVRRFGRGVSTGSTGTTRQKLPETFPSSFAGESGEGGNALIFFDFDAPRAAGTAFAEGFRTQDCLLNDILSTRSVEWVSSMR